jgi:hypothetical protein
MNYLASIVVVILVGTLYPAVVYCAAAAETAGAVLAKLNKLPAEQRQKALIEKAKTEGEVAFYSSLQAQQIDPFIRVFQKRYPFIKVNPYRGIRQSPGDQDSNGDERGKSLVRRHQRFLRAGIRDQKDRRHRPLSVAAARLFQCAEQG